MNSVTDAGNLSKLRHAALVRGGAEGPDPAAGQRRLSVLILDDDRDTADSLAMLVSLFGHDSRRAYNGADGLAMAMADWPDVVLLDLAMPKLDGCKVAVQLQKMAAGKECFLIAVTGYADEGHRRECLEAGIDLFLVKPVDALVIETLLMLERQRLGLSRAASDISDVKKYGAAQEAVLV